VWTHLETYFLQNWLPRWNQIINAVEVHLQLSNNGHPVDGVVVGAGSLCPKKSLNWWNITLKICFWKAGRGQPEGEGCTRLTSSEGLTFWIFFISTNLNESRPIESSLTEDDLRQICQLTNNEWMIWIFIHPQGHNNPRQTVMKHHSLGQRHKVTSSK
jgi:hypothetical protein